MGAVHQRFLDLPPADLQLLRQRSIDLGRQPAATEALHVIELLELQSRGQSFALPLRALEGVVELISVAPIPRAPSIVRGIVSFRGELLLGLELSALVGNSGTGIADLRRIVTLVSQTMKVAILAEKIITVRSAPKDSFRSDPSRRYPFVAGTDENFVTLLDPDLLVEHALQLLGSPKSPGTQR